MRHAIIGAGVEVGAGRGMKPAPVVAVRIGGGSPMGETIGTDMRAAHGTQQMIAMGRSVAVTDGIIIITIAAIAKTGMIGNETGPLPHP